MVKRMKARQRPPTQWLAHSVEKIMRASGVGRAAATRIAAGNWWHRMNPLSRKAAFEKHEPGGAHAPSRRQLRAKAKRAESARERARRLARSLPRRRDGKFLPMRAAKKGRRKLGFTDARGYFYGLFEREPRKAARSRKASYCRYCRGPHVRGHRS